MKKLYSYSLAAVAVLMLFSSCSKDEVKNPVQDQEEVVPVAEKVTISVSMPDEGLTKVTLTQDAENKKVIKLAWEYTDELVINGNTFTVKTGSISGDGKSAEFEGTAPTPDGGKYNISYSNLTGEYEYAKQTQSADGDASHLGYAVSISGADSYTGITFSEAGASAVKGTFSQSSVLRLRAKLPDAVASAVQKVIFKASENVFAGTNTVVVNLTTPGTEGDDKTLDVYATLPAGDAINAAAMDLLIQFQTSANAYDKYTAYRVIPASTNFGTPQYIGIDCSNIDKYAGKDDDGTAAHPYLIGDQHQMVYLRDLYKTAEDANSSVKYFIEMVDDVDMTGVSWIPFNRGGTYLRAIDFDGNGKRILNFRAGSDTFYPSFAGVLVGDLRNVTFESPNIDAGDNKAGVVAGYIGTGSNVGNCSRVTVIDATVQGTQFIGAFAGQVNAAGTIEDCHVLGTTTVTQNYATDAGRSTGGFIGNVSAAAVFTNCSVKATVTSPNAAIKGVGGFLGLNQTAGATFKNCEVLSGSSVSSSGNWCGGFVGYAQAKGIYGESGKPCTTAATVNGTGQYTGGFAGYIGNGNAFAYCNASGDITGKNSTGGFGGKIDGATVRLDNCSASGNVTGGQSVGGFAGEDTGNITYVNCSSSGDVDGSGKDVAGFCGLVGGEGTVAFAGHFENCHVYNESKTITIKGGGQSIGGFVGWIGHNTLASNTGIIEKCYVKNVKIVAHETDCGPYIGGFAGVVKTNISKSWAEGITIVANKNAVGGFVGYLQNPKVSDCYANGVNVTISNNNVGGFVGRYRSGTIQRCYSEGNVSASSSPYGGFVGANEGTTVSKCISWNSTVAFNGNGTVSDCYTKSASETGTILSHAQTLDWDFSTIWNEVNPPTIK